MITVKINSPDTTGIVVSAGGIHCFIPEGQSKVFNYFDSGINSLRIRPCSEDKFNSLNSFINGKKDNP